MKKRIFLNYFDGVSDLNDTEFVRLFFQPLSVLHPNTWQTKKSFDYVAVACAMIP
jgi:hypothetical protein